jgi:hypothetical protein
MAVTPDQPPAPPPDRLRRLIRPALWRSAARGLAAVLILAALVVPPVCLAWTMLAIFIALTVGLNLGLWAGRDSMLASIAGAVLMAVVGLVIALFLDVQIIGSATGPVALADIERFPHAARFRFTDARVATAFTAANAPRILGMTASTGWLAAPLVPTNWTPAEPVRAWAVATVTGGYGPLDYRSPRNWEQPGYRAGVRYVATAFSPAHDAVARSIALFGLTATSDAPLFFWVEQPSSVIADERTFLAWVMFGGVATWLLFLIGEALLVPGPVPPDVERRPPGRPRPAEAASAQGLPPMQDPGVTRS